MKEQQGTEENGAPLEANSQTPDYDLATFRKENEEIRGALHRVRYDIDSCDTLMDDDLDHQLAERISRDIDLLVGTFLHYSRKEQLVMPCLERHHDGEDSSSGGADVVTSSWENDNNVRGIIAMAASLMPGAEARPSAGNLQSVASQLAEACDVAETIVNEEETTLIPLMQAKLDAADWTLIGEELPSVKTPKVEDGSTWGPSPLDMAEARLRASQLHRNTK